MNLFLFVMLYVYHSDNFCTLTNLLSYPPPPRILLFSNKRYIPSSPTSIKYVAISFLFTTPPHQPFQYYFYYGFQKLSTALIPSSFSYCSLLFTSGGWSVEISFPSVSFFFSFNLIDTKKILPSINCVALKRKKWLKVYFRAHHKL